MKTWLKRVGVLLGVILILAVAAWIGWEVSRPTDKRIIGEWRSDPQKTLAYWAAHYDWAKDPRMVKARGGGLGRMSLEISEREIRFHDHPCYGSPVIRYRIVSQSEGGVDIGVDYSITLVRKGPWGRFEFEDGGMWSIAQIGSDEVREYFAKVERDRGGNGLTRAPHDGRRAKNEPPP